MNEMMALPQNAVVRRINELVKRARSVKVSHEDRKEKEKIKIKMK